MILIKAERSVGSMGESIRELPDYQEEASYLAQTQKVLKQILAQEKGSVSNQDESLLEAKRDHKNFFPLYTLLIYPLHSLFHLKLQSTCIISASFFNSIHHVQLVVFTTLLVIHLDFSP